MGYLACLIVGVLIGILAASMCVVAGEDNKRSGRK